MRDSVPPWPTHLDTFDRKREREMVNHEREK